LFSLGLLGSMQREYGVELVRNQDVEQVTADP
jgi:hypothetical protein